MRFPARLLIWLGLLFLFSAAAQPYGLDTRTTLAPFLNGKMPSSAPQAAGEWTTVNAFPNLTFEDPTFLTFAPRGNRLYVTSRQGLIYSFDDNPLATNRTFFLDLRSTTQGNQDCGLLGLAFHPDFGLAGSANRGYFYVWRNYSTSPITNSPPAFTQTFDRLSRFTVPDGSLVADPNSEMVLINQFDENLWHTGGGLFFGEDGFLYFANGDEGSADDYFNNAQKINSGLFSGVFRIDVNKDPAKSHPIRRQPSSGSPNYPPSYSTNYYIPNDNPFLDPGGSILEEFWALGVRSPHRMTFDPVTKLFWLGDVGQSTREEIDLIVKAGNYQWAYREGSVTGPKAKPATLIGTDRAPLYDYGRSSNDTCVIGGYVYRGSQHSDLYGKYIFGDNTSGRIWTLAYDGTNAPVVQFLCNMPAGATTQNGLTSFGLDQNNELYLCRAGTNGQILKLARTITNNPAPLLVSQTGAFTNLSTLGATNSLIPYDVNSALWSDGAAKRRWIAVPNDGLPYGVAEQISFSSTGQWSFPAGTVFIKHFAMLTNETNPNSLRKLETRFLVRSTNNSVYGLLYKWRADGSDADLLPDNFSETFQVQTASGIRTQVWYYPGRQDCLICHNANAGYVLGVNTRQLNGTVNYPSTGRTDNQLRTWNHLQMFSPAVAENSISDLERLVAITNTAAFLSERVRSYLDANCAHCHRPGGALAFFDARFSTAFQDQAIVNGAVNDALGISGAKVIVPGSIAQSIMRLRLNSSDSRKMPPLANNRIHSDAVAVFDLWINNLTNPPAMRVVRGGSANYLLFEGDPTMSYNLEATTNFSGWFSRGTLPVGARYNFDPDIGTLPHTFYRVRKP